MKTFLVKLLGLFLPIGMFQVPGPSEPAAAKHWVDIWATALVADRPADLPFPSACATSEAFFVDTTIRQSLRVSLPANRIRVRISNEYGDHVLTLGSVTAALPQPYEGDSGSTAGSGSIRPETLRVVRFDGLSAIDVAPHATVLSDPIDIPLGAASDVSISIYLPAGQEGTVVTGHLQAKSNSWFATGGDHSHAPDLTAVNSSHSYPRWYYLSGIEGLLDPDTGSIVCFGDSITDRGDGALPMNTYVGWTDQLFPLIQQRAGTAHLSVINAGISGERLVTQGLPRLARDVLSHPHVKYVILHEGGNDMGMTANTPEAQDELYHQLVAAYTSFAERVHSAGLPVIATTSLPFTAPPDWPTPWPLADPVREGTRGRLNRWILDEGPFDRVVDWARLLAEPDNPHMMQKRYQLTDYLHPNVEGYRVMAEAINLDWFEGLSGRGD